MARRSSSVSVIIQHPRGRAAGAFLARAGRQFLEELRVPAELSIAVTTDRGIRLLNRRYRRIDRPTDVLSFPGEPNPAPSFPRGKGGIYAKRLLGDVVISLDTAKREAAERGIAVEDELRQYLAHGVLHLLGHDHHRRRDAERMAAAERQLLGADGMIRRSGAGGIRRRRRRA
jgi:probable rRNA maturation factor